MPSCPQCHRQVSVAAIHCPQCHTELKAHGHPGMTLYRAPDDQFLCATCLYEADDSCNFPKRPKAKTCTLYQDVSKAHDINAQATYVVPWWRQINRFWVAITALISISLIIAVL